MCRRVVIILFAVAVLSAAVPSAAQTSGELAPRTSESEVRGLERLTPEERQRALENYQHWKSLTPGERQAARQNLQRLRNMPPSERARIMEDFQRWNSLPEDRKRELEAADR